MFGTIRKHQTGLWILIIALMSVSLLIFFLPGGGAPSVGGGKGRYGTIGGRPVKEKEWLDAMREVEITHFFRSGNWPGSEASGRASDGEALQRLLLINKLKELDIHPGTKAVAAMIQEQLGDHVSYSRFVQEHLVPHGLSTADYDRYLLHEAGIRQLFAAASVSAKFVSAPEAEVIYRNQHLETEVQLALFWASNYLDKVVITNGAISSFYSNRVFMYRVPERTIVTYVEFPATNYFAEADKELAAVTNLQERINENWSRWDTNDTLLKDEKGAPLAEAIAKQKIRDLIRTNQALVSAHRAAAQFGNELYGMKPDPNKTENLEKLAAEKKLEVKVSNPFDAVSGLEEIEAFTNATSRLDESFRETFRKTALALSNAAPVQFKPIPGPRAVYVIALRGKVPPKTNPLEEISEKVTNDYRNFSAQELARSAGMTFATNVTNGLALKKSFEEICKAENVKAVDVPPFSEITQSLTNFDARVNIRQLQYLSRDLEIGKATPYAPFSQDGGLVLYLKARPKLDDARVQAALPEFMGQLRFYRQNEAFNQWLRKQIELAKISMPPRPEPAAGAPK